jgi:antitoxin component YwqK of YwqJK toxin-antitoxin module
MKKLKLKPYYFTCAEKKVKMIETQKLINIIQGYVQSIEKAIDIPSFEVPFREDIAEFIYDEIMIMKERSKLREKMTFSLFDEEKHILNSAEGEKKLSLHSTKIVDGRTIETYIDSKGIVNVKIIKFPDNTKTTLVYYEDSKINKVFVQEKDFIKGSFYEWDKTGCIVTSAKLINGKYTKIIDYYPRSNEPIFVCKYSSDSNEAIYIKECNSFQTREYDSKSHYYTERDRKTGRMIVKAALDKNDRVDGRLYLYHKNESPWVKLKFRSGKKHGDFCVLSENQTKIMSGYYKNDKIHGSLYIFKHPFQCIYKIPFVEGVISGNFKEYYESGVIFKIIPLKNGKIEGYATINFENGKTAMRISVSNGTLEGLTRIYWEKKEGYQNKIKFLCEFFNGKIHGQAVEYYENYFFPKRITNWENGMFKEIVGVWDEKGNKIHSQDEPPLKKQKVSN